MIRLPFVREPRRGDVIRGDVRVPDGPPPLSAVVVAHGFKGFKDWGFFPFLCDSLAGAGHAVVSFNFSHSGVGPDGESFTELERFAAATLSGDQHELRMVLDEVLDGDLVPRRPRRVGLLGHSRGGGQVVLAAAAEPRVAALATWAAVATFDRWSLETRAEWRRGGRIWILNQRTGQQMPLDVALLEDFERNREELDVPAAAGRTGAPWLIVHGREDTTVPLREAEVLATAAPDARLAVVEGAGHTFEAKHPFGGAPPQLEQALQHTLAHFERHLRP